MSIQIQSQDHTDIQAEADKGSARAIEARAEQRAETGQGIDVEYDKKMALIDIRDFQRIQSADWQESAAVQMAENARKYVDYKTVLDNTIPGMAEKVACLDAANDKKVWAKEDRKAGELQSEDPEDDNESGCHPRH